MKFNQDMSFKEIALEFDDYGVPPPDKNAECWDENIVGKIYDMYSIN